jgi:hypothetical protein
LTFTSLIDENWYFIVVPFYPGKDTSSGLPGKPVGTLLAAFSVPFFSFSFPWGKSEMVLLKEKKNPHEKETCKDMITKLYFYLTNSFLFL